MESKRAPNFSAEEKAKLIEIIANKYCSVIENKKTDHTTIIERIRTWKMIENEFNAVSPNSYNRNWEVLKRFYENQKKTARQLKAKETLAKFKTGGGPEVIIKKDSADELLLSIINKKTIEGLGNTRDSNQQQPQTHIIENDDELVFEIENEEVHKEENGQMDDYHVTPLTAQYNNSNSPNMSFELLEDVDMEYGVTSPTWKRYKASDLKNAVNPALKANETPKKSGKEKALTNRRRPKQPITTLTSSHFSAKYNILLDRRLVLVEKQIKQIDEEKAFQAEERRLKLESLKLDIELKKKQLSKYTSPRKKVFVWVKMLKSKVKL